MSDLSTKKQNILLPYYLVQASKEFSSAILWEDAYGRSVGAVWCFEQATTIVWQETLESRFTNLSLTPCII